VAWAQAFLAVMTPGYTEVTPLIVSVSGIDGKKIEEHPVIRNTLDRALTPGQPSCHTVANTIFPTSLWNPSRERALLYQRYTEHAWPRVKKCPANNRGTYFQRLIAFENGAQPVNQLEHIISTWQEGNHRHSALQLSIFDPRHDHTDCRQMGFPCLHQVCFTPLGVNGCHGLAVTGFYATQYVFEKAYGNYLGLCRLGEFVAHEIKLRFVRMTCIAASARLGKTDKSDLEALADELRRTLNIEPGA
jgi:thymidylate synthase